MKFVVEASYRESRQFVVEASSLEKAVYIASGYLENDVEWGHDGETSIDAIHIEENTEGLEVVE